MASSETTIALLASTEPGRRNRRTIDAVALLGAAIVIGLTAVVAASAEEHDAHLRSPRKTGVSLSRPRPEERLRDDPRPLEPERSGHDQHRRRERRPDVKEDPRSE
jgi:hypothetical protein